MWAEGYYVPSEACEHEVDFFVYASRPALSWDKEMAWGERGGTCSTGNILCCRLKPRVPSGGSPTLPRFQGLVPGGRFSLPPVLRPSGSAPGRGTAGGTKHRPRSTTSPADIISSLSIVGLETSGCNRHNRVIEEIIDIRQVRSVDRKVPPGGLVPAV